MELRRVDELAISEESEQQTIMWRVERVGWTVMMLLVLAALLGLLGPGPLSTRTATDRGSLMSIKYERFVRYQAPSQFRIQLNSAAARDGKVRLWFGREFIASAQLGHIDPEPEQIELHPRGLIYVIAAPRLNESAVATIYFKPNSYGGTRVESGIDGGPEIQFNQWAYP